MGFEGNPLTWTNGRHSLKNIQCRLDIGLPSLPFKDIFLLTKVDQLSCHGSDHASNCIVIQKECFRQKRVHLFRFEEVWSKDTRCKNLIRLNWSECSSIYKQRTKSIQSLQHTLKDLRMGKVVKEIKRIKLSLTRNQGGLLTLKRSRNSKPWRNKEIN